MEERWPSRFPESPPSTGPRGTGCWTRRSSCAVRQRRWLRPGGGPARVRLSQLFAPGKNSLVIYSMMFPRAADDTSPGPPGGQTALLPLAEGPCPSCTALLDQLDGAAGHAAQHINLAVAAKAPLERVLTFAAERGWRRLRLLSSAGTTYNRDYLAETADGSQQP